MRLSRDSLAGQRIWIALEVQGLDGVLDGLVKDVCVCEGLMRGITGFEVARYGFDVVEFGRISGQPLDARPMGAGGQRGPGRLAGMDRAVVEPDGDGPLALAGLGTIVMIEVFRSVSRLLAFPRPTPSFCRRMSFCTKPVPALRNMLQKGDEVGAAPGSGGADDQPAVTPVEGPHHGDLSGLTGSRHARVCAAFGPGTGETGGAVPRSRRQTAARCRRLRPGPCAGQASGRHDHPRPRTQPVPGPPEAEPPLLRSTLESCEREMPRPSRRAISPARRDSVQFGRSSTSTDRSGAATLSAAPAFSGPRLQRPRLQRPPPSAAQARGQRAPSGHRPHHGQNRRAMAEPYPRAAQRPVRSVRWSICRASQAAHAPRSPRHDPRQAPEPSQPSSALRLPLQGVFLTSEPPRKHRRSESQPKFVGQPEPTCSGMWLIQYQFLEKPTIFHHVRTTCAS